MSISPADTQASPQAIGDIVVNDHTNLDVLLPEAIARAIELDLLDCDAIPALIAGVLRDTNVKEFLERLGVLACTGMHPHFICRRLLFTKCFRKGRGDNSRGQPILSDASTSI